jgi:hypothetical protein
MCSGVYVKRCNRCKTQDVSLGDTKFVELVAQKGWADINRHDRKKAAERKPRRVPEEQIAELV